jgi:hypothetical protein
MAILYSPSIEPPARGVKPEYRPEMKKSAR